MKNKVSAVFGFMDMCKIFVLQYNSKTTAASGNIFHGNGSHTQVQDLFYKGKSKTVSSCLWELSPW